MFRIFIVQMYNDRYSCWDDMRTYSCLATLQKELPEVTKTWGESRVIEVLSL